MDRNMALFQLINNPYFPINIPEGVFVASIGYYPSDGFDVGIAPPCNEIP